MAMFGSDAFGMELNSMDIAAFVGETHDDTLVRFGGDLEAVRQALPLDDQRVITCRFKIIGDLIENPLLPVMDGRQLAVHEHRRRHHLSAESLADGLVAETHAEDGDLV